MRHKACHSPGSYGCRVSCEAEIKLRLDQRLASGAGGTLTGAQARAGGRQRKAGNSGLQGHVSHKLQLRA